METADRTQKVPGLIIHSAALYDATVWLFTWGRERAFREKILRFVRLQPGETVLDVGCGTGSLAIAAKSQVGPTGKVYGIDASPEMLARARKKAREAGLEVIFAEAPAQQLPFPDGQFDAVVSTLMRHHLPRKGREECAREMRRVLKPGGRVLAVDFAGPEGERKGFLGHFHRHGHVTLRDIVALLTDAGLRLVESGAVGFRNLQFALAKAP
jgi:ubiquinone/menaquinone biosynthesis C-methylase UbiE